MKYRYQWRIIAIFLILFGFNFSAFATCNPSRGFLNPLIEISMPASITVEPDTTVGTYLFEEEYGGESVELQCFAGTQVWQGYKVLTSSDRRDDVMEGVYETNVPGIGIRAAWSESVTSGFESHNLVKPWAYKESFDQSVGVSMRYHVKVALVATGNIRSGVIDTSRLIADIKFDDLLVGEIRFTPTSVRVNANTCNLVNSNITVPLKQIALQDMQGSYSDILTDNGFKIDIDRCDPNLKVDYRFSSKGSTGVVNKNTLRIAESDHAAQGVGIQILDRNDKVIDFDQDYSVVTRTSDQQAITIPLKARYVKTGDVKAGKVDSVATFEVFYR